MDGIVQMLSGSSQLCMAAQAAWHPKRSDRITATHQHFSQQNCLRILEEIIELWLLHENLLIPSKKIKDVKTSWFAEMEAVAWMKISETKVDHHFKKYSIIKIHNIQIIIFSKILWMWAEKTLRNFGRCF